MNPYANFMGGQTQNPQAIGQAAGQQPNFGGAMMAGAGQGLGAPLGAPMGASGAPGGGQMDPRTAQALEQLIALQSQKGRTNTMNRQSALADQLRADANSQLQGRRVGIANVGAAALNGYLAGQQMREAQKTGTELDQERMQASRGLIDALRGGAKV